MLTVGQITNKLSGWDAGLAVKPMPEAIITEMLAYTKSQILAMDHTLNDIKFFDRAASVYSKFSLSSYSAVELGHLLDLPSSIILAAIERHGLDWQCWLRHKGFVGLDRGVHTVVLHAHVLTNFKCIGALYKSEPAYIYKLWKANGKIQISETGYHAFAAKLNSFHYDFPFLDRRKQHAPTTRGKHATF